MLQIKQELGRLVDLQISYRDLLLYLLFLTLTTTVSLIIGRLVAWALQPLQMDAMPRQPAILILNTTLTNWQEIILLAAAAV
jgi:hypothetical protein